MMGRFMKFAAAAMLIGTLTPGFAYSEEAICLSKIEAAAQQLAERASAAAKAEGWEVSPEKIERAKQRTIRTLRKGVESRGITIEPGC